MYRGVLANDKLVTKWAKILLAASALIQLLVLLTRTPSGYDYNFHEWWEHSWHILWRQGVFYPRWLPDSYQGYGAPSFYFYPPLTCLLSSVIYLVTGDHPAFVLTTLFAVSILASFFSFWWYLGSSGFSSLTRSWGALLYTFAPVRFSEVYVRSAIAEHLALAFFPLLLWGVERITEKNSRRSSWMAIAVGSSLIILVNVPSAVLAGFVILVGLLVKSKQLDRSDLLRTLTASVAALGLTAFYWLPMMEVKDYVQLQYLAKPFGSGSSLVDLLSGENLLFNGYAALSFIGAVALFCVLWKNKTFSERITFWLLVGTIALQLPYIFIWLFKYVFPFTLLQGADRLNLILPLIVAIVWSYSLRDTRPRNTSLVVLLWSVPLLIVASLALTNVRVREHKTKQQEEPEEYVVRWALPRNEQTERRMAQLGMDEVLPSQGVEILDAKRRAFVDSVTIQGAEAGSLTFHRFYCPLWQARVDGQPTSIQPDSLGRITVAVPKGSHSLTLFLVQARNETVSFWLSGMALAGIVGYGCRGRVKLKRERTKTEQPSGC